MRRAGLMRRGFTFVEVSIAMLVGFTIMGVAFTFYQHTTAMGDKAQQLSIASQAAAHFFYSLEQDIANLVPKDRTEECFSVFDSETNPEEDFGTRGFTFQRTDPGREEQIKWDANVYSQRRDNNIMVKYVAAKGHVTGFPDLWELSRLQNDPTTQQFKKTNFSTKETGTYAKDVRFTKVKMPTLLLEPDSSPQWFLRVTLLLVGDKINAELKANQQAPLVPLSALYLMTVDPTLDQGALETAL